MKRRKLGRFGPEVSAISLGAMSFGGFYGATSRDESFATLDAAWIWESTSSTRRTSTGPIPRKR